MRVVILRFAPIGDSLISFPILRALREKYANIHITFVGHPALLPLAQHWGLADEVYDQSQFQWNELDSEEGISSSKWLNLFQQSDLVIYLMRYSPDQLEQNLLAAGAREVIVPHGPASHNPSIHWAEYLAEPIGLHDVIAQWIPPITPGEKEFCLYNPPIAIHPGCSDGHRRWPAASFAAVINRLLRLRHPVLLLAGPMDTEQLQNVRRHLSTPLQPGMLTILKNAPLVELAQRIKQCKCYLGNDSGITHLAALLGVPTIAIFLPHFVVPMHPIGPAVEVIQEERIKHLSVERVFESVQKYM
ncbi:MAG: hypothetical protein NVSMB27_23700 [Ktedonobacteraceae bacterium]